MNLEALIARCQTRFRDEDAAVLDTTEWTGYLNDAYMDVVAASPLWPFLEARDETLSVAAGSGTVTLPADGWRVSAVYNATDGVPLIQLDGRAEYRHWFPNPSQSLGTPSFYRQRSNTLEVYPWAQVATELDVDLYLPPAALTTGQEPVFAEQYHRVLVAGALAYAYEDDGNLEQANVQRSRFNQLLGDMLTDLLGPRGESYPAIIDSL